MTGFMRASSPPGTPVDVSKQRKMLRYFGLCKAAWRPRFCREIGGGGFVVNAKGIFTRSLGGLAILPLPRTGVSASVRAEIRSLKTSPDRLENAKPGPICAQV